MEVLARRRQGREDTARRDPWGSLGLDDDLAAGLLGSLPCARHGSVCENYQVTRLPKTGYNSARIASGPASSGRAELYDVAVKLAEGVLMRKIIVTTPWLAQSDGGS